MIIGRIKAMLGLGGYQPLKTVPYPRLTRAWERRFKKWPPPQPSAQNGSEVAVLITPWLSSAVPFFNFEIALMLASAGQRVTLLWDYTDIIGNAPASSEIQSIAKAMESLPPWINVVDVSARSVPGGDTAPLDDKWIENMLFQNGVWRMRGEGNAASYVKRKLAGISKIREHVSRVYTSLKGGPWTQLIIPGGMWGLSSLYVALAEKLGLEFATYDCGAQTATICHQGVACHQSDISIAADLAGFQFSEESKELIRQRAFRELNERTQGRGNYDTFQVRAAGGSADDYNVLVPLNQRWDAAALGRERLFATVEEWIIALLQWAKREPAARVCIRQHPVERLKEWRGTDDIGELIRRENQVGDRVRFVAAEEPISTYDLLRVAKVVSPYTSSVGVEAGMLGVPVVVSARNYYDRASFVWHPETKEQYFDILSQAVREGLAPPKEGVSEAALFYHLVQECNILPTQLVAGPIEYLRWVKIAPEELWAESSCIDIRESLLTGRPLSFIRSRRLVAAETAAIMNGSVDA